MAYRKRHCIGDCDFTAYYNSQAGGALSDINIFRGVPYQRGFGIASVFKRFGIPLLKFLGRNLLKTGMTIGTDILSNGNIKDIVKKRTKEGAKQTAKEGLQKLSDLVDQTGSGHKRKLYKASKSPKKSHKIGTTIRKTKPKRVKKDIFS
jgi:hypothetical protein